MEVRFLSAGVIFVNRGKPFGFLSPNHENHTQKNYNGKIG
ncbi:MAG: hypothetical protein BWY63_00406 [Chloroflexi bacterium ADurb.Bin360]|nr:MAG: hypothetical protein BWY63_00406 [Chloroflexi bacterium ADurb.Bin360]